MADAFDKWRRLLAGEKVPLHEDEPLCGYWKTRDHTATKMDGRRWPMVACAVWVGPDGALIAERAGRQVPVEWLWPYYAKNPITFETYTHWHQHHSWPKEAEAA